MRRVSGVPVEGVTSGSPADLADIRKGDLVLSANGKRVHDLIDLMFQCDGPELKLNASRRGREFTARLSIGEGEPTGIEPGQFKVRTCRNNCIFCFVSQLPKGLRKSLYVKDEDFRMSFLYGNYVTLADLSADDRKRIVRQRLSPIYVSVHTTDLAMRRLMLGNPKAPDIMKDLRFLKENGIRMHTQIVLCPGMNDGKDLARTIRELGSLYPHLQSIAVVPVGLTSHRRRPLAAVGREEAAGAIETVAAFQRRFRKKHGDPVVYASDEMYIKAGQPFPPIGDYGELPQIENGVGMVPLFLSDARRLKPPAHPPGVRALTFTGTSFHPYLKAFTERIKRHGTDITAVAVENHFFGPSVTVTGLLTGRDVIRALLTTAREFKLLLVPDVVLREGLDVFLDDVSVADIEKALKIKAIIIESTPSALIREVSSWNEDKRKD